MSPSPGYSVVTAPPTGSGNCFHLCHVNPVPQLLQLNELMFPSNSTTISFKSLLGYATTNEVARVQISTDGGGTWQNIFTEAGSNGAGESAFTQHTLSLTNYAGKSTRLRFDYDFSTGSYYPQTNNYVGWCIENLVVSNCQQLLNQTTNSTSSTNFVFSPALTGNYLLQARGVIFDSYPIDFGTAKGVTAIAGQPAIMVNSLAFTGSQVKVGFALTSGTASSFHLLQMDHLGGPWVTNGTAVLTTNVPGSSFQFTTTSGPPMRLYRVVTP
jgi:hypothetical protein